MLANPLLQIFVSPGTGDFHLTSNSQAINAGNSGLAYGVITDIEGVGWPQGEQHDLGAYEFQGPLSVDEEDEDQDQAPDLPHGVQVTDSEIHWSGDLNGTLGIFTLNGFQTASFELREAGSLNTSLLPFGLYLAVVFDHYGVLGTKGFFVK